MKESFKNIKEYERPRERLIKYGESSLRDEEIVAILLRTGTNEKNVKELAREFLNVIDNLSCFNKLSFNSLKNIKGIGTAKATTLLAAYEFGKRCLMGSVNMKCVMNAEVIYNSFKYDFINESQERLEAIFLDVKKQIIARKCIFKGTVNSSVVHPRDVFREAIKYNAVSVILIHNHPSGNSEPSLQDDIFTKNMISIGKLIDINVIDHIIFGNNTYYSYYNSKWGEMHE